MYSFLVLLGGQPRGPRFRRHPADPLHPSGSPEKGHPARYALVSVFRRILRCPSGVRQQLVRRNPGSRRYDLPVCSRTALHVRSH